MHLRPRRIAFFLAASTIAAGFTIFACSTDNGTTTLPTPDTGRTDTGGGGDPDVVDPPLDPCRDAFAPRPSTGPRCLGVIDAGGEGGSGGKNCVGKTEICCSDGQNAPNMFEPSECITGMVSGGNSFTVGRCNSTFTADGGTEWHCTEKDHCPGTGSICCMIPGPGSNGIFPQENDSWPGCAKTKFQNSRFVGGTRCKATCAAGEIQLCSSNTECTAGECIFLSSGGRNIGYCRVQ